MMKLTYLTLAIVTVLVVACGAPTSVDESNWTAGDLKTIRSLSIAALGPLPKDHSNRYADDTSAAALGHRLFFDSSFSSNGKVACATCHLPDRGFQDDVPLATGVGTTSRRTMPIAGMACSPWLFWDGRKDNLWSQALGPLESAVEHGGTRTQYAHVIAEQYQSEYEAIFGLLPDLSRLPRTAGPGGSPEERQRWASLTVAERDDVNRVFANIGKAIAAYERRLQYGPSRFDRWVETLDGSTQSTASLTAQEQQGLRLFIGKASCVQCHNGPLFTDNSFHNTGVPAVPGLPNDVGRAQGALDVLADEFNCRGRYSDANGDCPELEYMVAHGPELMRAYKTSSLRGVADRAPYMHAGQIRSLRDVLSHYNAAPEAPAGHSEIKSLELSDEEIDALAAFLKTLSGPLATEARFLREPARR